MPARGGHQRGPSLRRAALPHQPPRPARTPSPWWWGRRPRHVPPVGPGARLGGLVAFEGGHRAAQHVRAAQQARPAGSTRAAPGRAPWLYLRHRPRAPGAGDIIGDVIRVLLAEDQAMIREALAALLSFEDDIEVVAQVGRGDEVTRAARHANPDVALLDIEMPGMDGLSAAAALRAACPDVKIIILTTFGRPGYLRRAMESGASGFIVVGPRPRTSFRPHHPRRAGLASRSSTPTWPPPRRRRAQAAHPAQARTCSPPPPPARAPPSPRPAAAVYLSEGTVRSHLSSCIQKTGARNRAESRPRRPGPAAGCKGSSFPRGDASVPPDVRGTARAPVQPS